MAESRSPSSPRGSNSGGGSGSVNPDWTELHEVCQKLLRDSGGRKVLLCRAEDGEVLSHAGAAGFLDDHAAEALAGLVADLALSLAAAAESAVEEATLKLGEERGAAGALVGAHAVVVVLFTTAGDGSTSAERVKTKLRRAAELLGRLMESAPARLS